MKIAAKLRSARSAARGFDKAKGRLRLTRCEKGSLRFHVHWLMPPEGANH